MFLQIRCPRKSPFANCAVEKIRPSVGSDMFLQVSRRRKLLITRDATEFFTSVLCHVRLQLRRVVTDFIAHRTLVRLLSGMLSHMHRQLRGMREFLPTKLARELLAGVLFHMNRQMRRLGEGFVAKSAAPGTVTRMGF